MNMTMHLLPSQKDSASWSSLGIDGRGRLKMDPREMVCEGLV
jgi:hypothetical protein